MNLLMYACISHFRNLQTGNSALKIRYMLSFANTNRTLKVMKQIFAGFFFHNSKLFKNIISVIINSIYRVNVQMRTYVGSKKLLF